MDTTIDDENIIVDDNVEIPPYPDGGIVPIIEWWDEIYIAKNIRDDRKKSKANYTIEDHELLELSNVKTWKYVQHPVSIKPIGGEKVDVPLPMFLTKKERKRSRKTERAAREQEKRDKQMMGLIPVAEPKFKLSNFMKVLGDQAVADPSKVEMKVIQQMKQRQLNHEMRNQAAKKTPAEKWAKKMKKYQEDTSRQVSVACFWIKDFSHPGNRYKVDVNAQLYYLSGTGKIHYHHYHYYYYYHQHYYY
jgi:U4/U6 small nuclear ribonucleoprotein PRP3